MLDAQDAVEPLEFHADGEPDTSRESGHSVTQTLDASTVEDVSDAKLENASGGQDGAASLPRASETVSSSVSVTLLFLCFGLCLTFFCFLSIFAVPPLSLTLILTRQALITGIQKLSRKRNLQRLTSPISAVNQARATQLQQQLHWSMSVSRKLRHLSNKIIYRSLRRRLPLHQTTEKVCHDRRGPAAVPNSHLQTAYRYRMLTAIGD